jgi:membrane fusion protein, copper/silver efflux system
MAPLHVKRVAYGLLLAACMAGGFLMGSYQGQRKARTSPVSGDRRVLYYVDPMNPTHTSDQPGLAPCGMKMEPVYADQAGAAHHESPGAAVPGMISINPEKQQLIGVRLGTVEHIPYRHLQRLLGRVALNDTRVYKINATVSGWVTKTLPNATGTQVKRHEVLGAFYSPEFLSAGQALLFALNSKDRAQGSEPETATRGNRVAQFNLNLQQYQDTLKNLGMGDRQLEEMIDTRKFMQNIEIVSPADGFITERNISEGQRFEKGTEFFRIADLSQVWILADLFASEANLVQPDLELRVSLPRSRKTYRAKVSHSIPQFDGVSRTLKLRLEAENLDFDLKPDMFVDVELPVDLPATLVVPAEAVLDAGVTKTVFVARGNGRFESRAVQTGWRYSDQVQILQGLQPGEKIAISGIFLLDSESRMKQAATGGHEITMIDPVCGMLVNAQEAKAGDLQRAYQGNSYCFCSLTCLTRFDRDPHRFLEKDHARNSGSTTNSSPPVTDRMRP